VQVGAHLDVVVEQHDQQREWEGGGKEGAGYKI